MSQFEPVRTRRFVEVVREQHFSTTNISGVNNIPKAGVNNVPNAGVNKITKAGVDVISKAGMKGLIRRARFTTYG